MSTQSKHDQAALQELDFTPQCAAHLWRDWQLVNECQREAEWAGIKPCCGHVTLFCSEHAHARLPFCCRNCGHIHDERVGWRWHRL